MDESRLAGSFARYRTVSGFVCYKTIWQEILKDIIRRGNFARYRLVIWLRQQGKKFREIGNIMNISSELARTLVSFVDLKIEYKKPL